MLEEYGIKDTIATRTNEYILSDFSAVPSFEGRIIVYENRLAGAKLKTYGTGVNIYVNEFALYNYLAEENDWLGLADYSMRKKVTRLKPHNVFGYVNFPSFNEHQEKLKISNERADFIQDLTFIKLMYLLKGVVMFSIFNIDVADKNPQYKTESSQEQSDASGTSVEPESSNNDRPADKPESENAETEQESSQRTSSNHVDKSHTTNINGPYSPEGTFKPKKAIQKSLSFTAQEGNIINSLKNSNDLSDKIYNLVFELSKLDFQYHRYSISFIYRALLESSTKYLSQKQSQVQFTEKSLEQSIVSALNYFGNTYRNNTDLSIKIINTWRDTITKRKLIDTLNQYIHNELPVDAIFLQETWNTMKGFIMTCLTI